VPGEVAGYYEAWRRFGRLPWKQLLQPTIEMCRDGYQVQRQLADDIRRKESFIRRTPSLRYVIIIIVIIIFCEWKALSVFSLLYLRLAVSSVLWHCWLGNRKGIQPVKSWLLVCWWWWFDWSFARLIAPVVTTHHLHHP